MPTNVVWNGTTYSIPDSGELNWSTLSTFLVALGQNAAIAQEMKQAIRTVTTTPDTVSDTADFAVLVNVTSGASTINLPAGTEGRIFCIGDISGTVVSGSRPITITPNGVQTINGASSFVISKDRQFILIQFTGTNWTILASYVASGQIVPSDLRFTTKGGLITSNGTIPAILSPGADGTALVADAAETAGLKWASLATDPTTTRGDLIRRGASALERLAAVTNNRVVRGNGTDVISGQIDNTDFFTTGAAATASAIGIVTTTAQSFAGIKTFTSGAPILGTTTNDNAATGYIGEYLTATGTQTNYSDMVIANAATISLTAGDWDVQGTVSVDGASATIDLLAVGLSTSSATFTSNQYNQAAAADGTVLFNVGRADAAMSSPVVRFSLSSTTTIYLCTRAGFVANTPRYIGFIRARRVR
jgi:hypothetical protein